MCGNLCLQHKVNEFLDGYRKGMIDLKLNTNNIQKPKHIDFV